MQMSTFRSRRAVNEGKGNHRRTYDSGGSDAWGPGEYPSHSFENEVALFYDDMKPYANSAYGFFDSIPVCSECGCITKMRERYSFCPYCGARMVSE